MRFYFFPTCARLTAYTAKIVPIMANATACWAAGFCSGPNPVFGKIGVPEVGVMVNRVKLEAPPPGVGFTASTTYWPVTALSEAGITAVNWVDETRVVGRAMPLNLT